MGSLHEHYKGFGAVHKSKRNQWTGNGWTDLIYACHDELVVLDPYYAIVQIKEKFGGLRYYFASNEKTNKDIWDKMHEVVNKYEKLSYKTCEYCGEPGSSSEGDGFWIKTICPTCAASQETSRETSRICY